MEGLPKDVIHACLCPYLSLVDLARCAQVSHQWFETFCANGAFRHIKDKIDAAVPLEPLELPKKKRKKEMYFCNTHQFLKYRVYPLCTPPALGKCGNIDTIIRVLQLWPDLRNLPVHWFVRADNTVVIEFDRSFVFFIEYGAIRSIQNFYGYCNDGQSKICNTNDRIILRHYKGNVFENALYRLLFPGRLPEYRDPWIP
jgi:hypothetical protein